MSKQLIMLTESMFLIIWFQSIAGAVQLWRLGRHFDGGYLLGATTIFAVLGVIALRLGIRRMQREGLAQ